MSRRGSSTSRPGAARPEDSPGTGGFLPLPLAGVGGGRRERGAGKDGGALVQQRGGGVIPQSLAGGQGGSSLPSPPEPEQWGEPAPAQAQLWSRITRRTRQKQPNLFQSVHQEGENASQGQSGPVKPSTS